MCQGDRHAKPENCMRTVLCYPVEPHHIDQLAAVSPSLEVIDAGQDRIADELLNADIFIGHAKVPVPWPEVVAAGRLKWIQSSAAGLDHCLTKEVIASDIPVTSASGLFANQVAEQTFALLFGILRSMPTFYEAQRKHEFVRQPTDELHGKRVGIVGFGGNGRRIAEVLAPFHLRMWAADLFPVHQPAHIEHLYSATQWPAALPDTDILIITLPLNSDTEGLIAAETFANLRRGGIVINVARGPVVAEADLIEALRSGQISAAGVDVTEIEPLPESSPLWEIPGVIITPHVGAQSRHRVDVTTDFAAENLRRFLAGQPLMNLVDKRLGFPRPENHSVLSTEWKAKIR
jgi:phosphoglycerate dehydrogenase-like enzyme